MIFLSWGNYSKLFNLTEYYIYIYILFLSFEIVPLSLTSSLFSISLSLFFLSFSLSLSLSHSFIYRFTPSFLPTPLFPPLQSLSLPFIAFFSHLFIFLSFPPSVLPPIYLSLCLSRTIFLPTHVFPFYFSIPLALHPLFLLYYHLLRRSSPPSPPLSLSLSLSLSPHLLTSSANVYLSQSLLIARGGYFCFAGFSFKILKPCTIFRQPVKQNK